MSNTRHNRVLPTTAVMLASAAWISLLHADAPTTAPVAATEPSRLISPEDGWLDISGAIDQAYGFVPLAMPITEPAVGYGAAGGVIFIDKGDVNAQEGARPNLTAAMGMATENGTVGGGAADIRHWDEGNLQTVVGAFVGSVNLDYYGIGHDSSLDSEPASYNLEPVVGFAQAKRRIGDTDCFLGLSYAFATTDVSFDSPSPRVDELEGNSRVGGITPSLTYDTRNNFFTPTNGSYVEASAGLFDEAFGGDSDCQRYGIVAMHYIPLNSRWTLGLRGDTVFSYGEVPFYMRPFVMLRGVPAMRYQGEDVAYAEAELRWQFWQRFSLVGFMGTGAAWNEAESYDDASSVVTGGGGFRYELARKYGLHMGADIAVGPEEAILYIQFGSAWIRP